ncbi:MAG: fumarate hydratase [Bacillota bacterium]|nr:fumarate hydratase [Bacillota bacterium]
MREVTAAAVMAAAARLCVEANLRLGEDVLAALEEARKREESPTGREILAQLVENARIAWEDQVPVCQDTGYAVFFVELGQEVQLVGGTLEEAINAGVRRGYTEGYLRKSIVGDPLERMNTGDNTPAVIHVRSVPGDRLRLRFMAKGAGSENMSRLAMLKPSAGWAGVKEFVRQAVREAGSNPCPPLVLGVAVGGDFEQCALAAKEALLRKVGEPQPEPRVAGLERELLEAVNDLGLGPGGLGGRVTALAVHLALLPTHIAALPVGVAFACHAYRHGEAIL